MEHEWLSAEQVAELLGLHVRTVRGYVRDGRLRAVRIGKQYRIARADLDAFTGRPAESSRPSDSGRLRVEASTVVEVDGIASASADRLSTLLIASAQSPRDSGDPLRIRTVYDDTRGRLKVIILGGVTDTAAVLQTIHEILGTENNMLPVVDHG